VDLITKIQNGEGICVSRLRLTWLGWGFNCMRCWWCGKARGWVGTSGKARE